MIGIPGSGKTTLAGAEFPTHTHISLDRNRYMNNDTRRGLLERYASEENLSSNLSNNRKVEYVMIRDTLGRRENVVIDNTNVTLRPDPQLRIGPSLPIILQICASKHVTLVRLCQKSCSYVPAC